MLSRYEPILINYFWDYGVGPGSLVHMEFAVSKLTNQNSVHLNQCVPNLLVGEVECLKLSPVFLYIVTGSCSNYTIIMIA